MTQDKKEKHPAAQNANELVWAVFIGDSTRDSQIEIVTGDSEERARKQALDQTDVDGDVVHIDGPYPDADAGTWEFEYTIECQETVIVEGPNKEYAKERAESKRSHHGEYKRTVHTESRRISSNE